MSDYIDDTPLTDEEIAAAIAAAKKAKAEKAKAQKPKNGKNTKNEKPKKKAEPKDDESSESLFDEIDSTYEEDKPLSPKMESARSFSNAFAAARSRREEALRKKKTDKETKKEEAEEQIDAAPARDLEEPDEEVVFDTDGETSEGYSSESEEIDEEEYDSEEVSEFNVDDEDEYYTADGEDSEQVEFDGIFRPDDEDTPNFGERVSVDDIQSDDDDDDDDDEYDDDDDDDDEGAVSTKAKVIIAVIIAVLVLAVAGAVCYFVLGGDPDPVDTASVVSNDGTGVQSLSFAEDSMSLRVGETAPLNIIIEPEDAEDKVLKLKSGNTSIATVDSTGVVTGVSSGSTTVTATLKSNETITATVVINVIDENQNAINIYNSFINSILDGSTDIDGTDTDESEDEFNNEEDTESDSDTDTEEDNTSENVLTGSIIRDLNDDGELELALYYTNETEGSSVRIFYLADDTDEDEEAAEDTAEYDEYGNPIESEETDTETEEDTDSEQSAPVEKVLTELDIYSEMYSVCYNTIETDATSWDTVYLEIKEAETDKVRVTILSDDYTSPTYVYESSDETIATVDSQGTVTAVAPGTCDITVTSPLNSDAKATVRIKVKDDTDLLDEYLAQIPIVNSTNDAVIPTETLVGKKITDIDGDGISELLLKFSYGNNVETINMVKIENEQCVVYKTYNNLSDLYDYYEGDGSYKNSILIHYTTGKVCMEYEAVVAKEDSKTRNSEQKILSVEDSGSLSELVSFSTTTEISTKTVTSEVVVEDSDDVSSSPEEDSDTEWYDPPTDDSDDYYSDDDNSYYDDGDDYNGYYDDDDYGYDNYYAGYAALDFDDIEDGGSIDLGNKTREKTLPQITGEPYDEDGDIDDYTQSDENNDDDEEDDEPVSQVTSTVTSEVTEETTKYFVNGTPVDQSVYEETLSTWSSRYAVWSDWDGV